MPSYSPPTRTVGEVITEVTRTFGDTSGIVLTTDDIVRWINDASTEIVERNLVLKAQATIPTVPNQQDYPLQQFNIQEIDSVVYQGRLVENLSFAQAQEWLFDGSNTTAPGNSVFWWMFDGSLSMWPVPQGTEPITLYYAAKPMKVINDPKALLPLPDKYYPRVVEYVLSRAQEMDEDWQSAQQVRTRFDSSVTRMGQEEKDAASNEYSYITEIDW